jgi:transcription initiation factor IIE alpha subunit
MQFTIVNQSAIAKLEGDIILNDAKFELRFSELDQLPPSAILVIKALEPGSPLTQTDIMNRTSLSSRTVRWALARLNDKNLIIKRSYFRRQVLYSLRPHSLELTAYIIININLIYFGAVSHHSCHPSKM